MRQKLAPAIFLLLLSFFTGGLSAQKQAVHKKYILHQIASLDGKSFSYDTTWMYYKLMVSPFDMYQIDTLWVDGKYQEIKRDKKSDVPEHIELNNTKTKLKEQQDQIKEKSDSIKILQKAQDELKAESASKQAVKPLQSLEYSCIGKQKWTSMNLSEADLKSISKDFAMANSDEEWKDALIKGTPAYCYHRDDNNKTNGVLLNLFALKKLHDKLEEMHAAWRLPVQSDFDNLLNTLKSVKGVSVVSMLTSSTTTIPAWKKPGIDLFDMHIIPLSYRRNNATQWYGSTEATIYCMNADDLGLKTTLKMVEINDSEEDKNTLVIKSKDITGEDNNIGVYVRLIKK